MAEMFYCSLADARQEINATERTISDDDVMMRIRQVSRRIDRIMGGRSMIPYFAPYINTRTIPISPSVIDSYHNTLLIRDGAPLLALTGATADGTDIISSASVYPPGGYWYRQVRINSNGNRWYSYVCNNGDVPVATLTGVWGYHSDYANAWRLSGQTLAADIISSATSFTVSDVDGADPYGFVPALSRGQLVRFGSSGTDYAILTATNTDNNTVSMVRSVLGGTGAAQTSGTAVYVWDVEEPIRRVTARQAGLFLARRGAYDNMNLADTGTIQYPPDLLKELAQVLQDYLNG